ncbi:MAG TPA: alpha-L-fucosidase [Verrucomicrobiae bacterium]
MNPATLVGWKRMGGLSCGLACAAFLAALSLDAQEPAAGAAPKPYPQRLRWWAEARFGMFIHWGPVSLTGQEIGWARGAQVPIAEYDQLYTKFNPTNFNADAWVKTAKDAGMKYVVLTTKHHDGFCLFDTKQTDYNVMRSPFGRDVSKELSDACKRAGLRFCTYHSVCDWHHPDFPLTSPGGSVKRATYNLDRYEQYLRAQVKELITQYGPLGIMWFDVPQQFDATRGQGLIDFAMSLQPDLIINDRSGAPGDYDTPEQRVGKYQDNRPWETCMTICQQWAWKPNDEMKSLAQCLQTLVTCAAGDGNLLFNVGPMPDGIIEPRQVARLKEMGAWLARNGESIYGTRGGPWKPNKAFASTRKGSTVFLHIFRAEEGRVELPALPRPVKSASRLAGGAVKFSQQDGKLTLALGPVALDPIDTIVRLELDGSAMDIPVVQVVGPGSVKATASNVFQQQTSQYGPQEAFDGDADTRWATDGGTKKAWLAADLGKPKRVRGVRIEEAIEERVRQFEFQCGDGSSWKTVFMGQKIGPSFVQKFEPVTAQHFRLNILDATEGPTINEIELLEK